MTELHEILLAEISARGPLPFDRYMELCLYHPDFGYYARGPERSGRRGDYVTSPELDPGFGRLWARSFEDTWVAAGRPDRFAIVEIGPGEGGFASSVVAAAGGAFRAALKYILVEPLPALEARQRERLDGDPYRWVDDIDAVEPVEAGAVFANEILDNVPVALIEGTSSDPVEVGVATKGGALVEVTLAPRPEVLELAKRFGIEPPPGFRAEVPLAAENLVASAARAIGRGAVHLIDYGDTTPALLQRPGGTLLCYSERGADAALLETPGNKDITAHANWDVVAAALSRAGMYVEGPVPQRDVLQTLGASDLFDELRREERDASAAGRGRDAIRAISRRGALSVLTAAHGLGALDVMTGTKGTAPPAWARA